MADNSVSLDILVGIQSAVDNLQKFESSANEATESVKGMFEGLKTVAEAALVFFAIEKLKEFGEEAIKLAADQESAQRRLATAMQLSGEYSKDAAAEFSEFGEQLQRNSRFSEDAATGALTIAKNFGLTNDQAKQLVTVSADLAAQLGTGLDTQVEKLGRTFTGSTGRLTRMFPELKQFSEEQLKAGAAVEFLGAKFAGAAASDIQTYAGATQQVTNAQDDLLKSIGHFITDSPVMIARIENMAETWRSLKEWVTENKDEIQEWVDVGIKGMVLAVPLGVSALYYVVQAFEAVAGTLLLAGNGILMLTDLYVTFSRETLGNLIDGLFRAEETVLNLAQAIPGAGAAFDKMGVDINGATEYVEAAHKKFDDFADGAVSGVKDASDGLMNFTVETGGAFENLDIKFNDFQQKLADTAQKILDSDKKIGDSAELSGSRRNASYGLSQKAIDELLKDLAKLDQSLFNATASAAEKAEDEYDQFLDKINQLHEKGIIDADGANERQAEAYQIYSDKLTAIHQKSLDEQAAADAKAAAEQLHRVQAAGADPANYLVMHVAVNQAELSATQKEISDSLANAVDKARTAFAGFFTTPAGDEGPDKGLAKWTGDQVTEGLAAGLGAASNILDGAAGAGKFVSGMAGAIANAYLPGLGPVVQGIVDKLEAGPEAVKGFVEGFVKALPEILENIAESGPAIIEGLVDALINKGGLVRIALAWADIITAGPWMREAGKMIGLSFGDSLSAKRIGPTIASEWHKDMAWLDTEGPKFGNNVGKGISTSLQGTLDSMQAVGDKIRLGWVDAPARIGQGFDDGVKAITQSIGPALDTGATHILDSMEMGIRDFGTNISASFAESARGFVSSFGVAFQGLLGGLGAAGGAFVKSLTDGFHNTFGSWKLPALPEFNWPEINTPGWLYDFTNAVDRLASIGNVGGNLGGGGGGGGFIGQASSAVGSLFKHAKGLDLVPAGYPNDTYLAGLTENEGVVDAQTNPQLRQMVADYASGKINADVVAMLGKIAQLLGQPQTVVATAMVDKKAFADITLQLNRQNARLRA